MVVSLKAQKREAFGRKNQSVREEGWVPGVIYGKKFNNASISVRKGELEKVLRQGGSSGLVKVEIEGGENIDTLLQDFQYHHLSGDISHVDFLKIDMNEPITASASVVIKGKSKAITELAGTLINKINRLTIKCLPKDLISSIEIDISVIEKLGQSIKVKDVVPPAGVQILNYPTDVIVVVPVPRLSKHEEASAAEQVGPLAVEKVETKKKEDGEEGAEAPAAGSPAVGKDGKEPAKDAKKDNAKK
ncbi:MAG: large subunit ribosomal protein L25 [Parcubacteria group bacterium Gr01-1014_18]|nr:MAG: large subunit ribosomal protein L25 [Parcubacteria group bacterium Greene0416_36]TSC81375.1 MAG: large subunit ribosomal protein L25 [Parcubacteria group bacterium Gr01-1014_18]TSC99439.1 MAG: large subunit ribosomal protein L25 [Parcubacteria group bacterium Greene1014_20]TSD07642.1 MAG: large subunit ribosomal protein L25 [Parcubacteria group bacterium Greene0714_2]